MFRKEKLAYALGLMNLNFEAPEARNNGLMPILYTYNGKDAGSDCFLENITILQMVNSQAL